MNEQKIIKHEKENKMREIIFNEDAGWICPDCGAHLDYKREPHDCEEPKEPKVEKKPEPKEEPKKDPEVEEKDPEVEEGEDGQLRFKFDFTKTKEKLKKS